MFNETIFPKSSLSGILASADLQRCGRLKWLLAALFGMFILGGSFVATASAQDTPAKKDDAATDDTTDKAAADAEEVTLETDDGWNLAMSYYPGTKGKDSTPVVLLHSDAGSSKDFTVDDFAKNLQAKGYAVLAPDFRYHGASVKGNAVKGAATKVPGGKAKPASKAKSAKSLPPQAYKEMVLYDMLAVKRFLWKKNNEGKLNIDKLVLIGCEMGADIAIETVLYDAKGWDQSSATIGKLKLGRFVKAIVLISPPIKQLGLKPLAALENSMFPPELGILLMSGVGGSPGKEDFNQFKNILEKLRPLQSKVTDVKDKTLITMPAATKLQGINLIKEFSTPEKDYPGKIDLFIGLRVENAQVKKENKWSERKIPYE